MTRPFRKLAFVSLFAVAGAFVVAGATSSPARSEAPAPTGAVVGQAAPDFTLTDETGKKHTLSAYKGKTVVLEWTNPGCPFVVRHYKAQTMKKLAAKHKDVVWLAINSTASNTADASKKWAKAQGLAYPTLQDADGAVGKRYGARTTPHMFVVDEKGVLRYAGAIDSDPPGKAAAPTNYVDGALAALASGKDPAPAATEPYGCSVKYRK